MTLPFFFPSMSSSRPLRLLLADADPATRQDTLKALGGSHEGQDQGLMAAGARPGLGSFREKRQRGRERAGREGRNARFGPPPAPWGRLSLPRPVRLPPDLGRPEYAPAEQASQCVAFFPGRCPARPCLRPRQRRARARILSLSPFPHSRRRPLHARRPHGACALAV